MRTIIVACALALAACGKPAEDKKTEKRDTPAPSQPPSTPAPAQLTPSAPAPGVPLTDEEKAKEVTKIEEKIVLVDEAAAKVTEDMRNAASATEREQLVKKLEHLVAEKAELKKQMESYGAR